VLDAWAVMAWVNGEEPAGLKVQSLLDTADAGQLDLLMSMINVGEVYYLLVKEQDREAADYFWKRFQTSSVRIVQAPNDLIFEAAQLKSRFPISYADAFAAATAVRRSAALVTGDPDFRPLADAGVITLEWIGR